MRKLIEGYVITDKNHHCLKHNLEKLKGVDVRVNGERGLRAKRVRCHMPSPFCSASAHTLSHCQVMAEQACSRACMWHRHHCKAS